MESEKSNNASFKGQLMGVTMEGMRLIIIDGNEIWEPSKEFNRDSLIRPEAIQLVEDELAINEVQKSLALEVLRAAGDNIPLQNKIVMGIMSFLITNRNKQVEELAYKKVIAEDYIASCRRRQDLIKWHTKDLADLVKSLEASSEDKNEELSKEGRG